MNKITPILIVLILSSCQNPQQSETTPPIVAEEEKSPDKIYSLMNAELPSKSLSEEARRLYESKLNVAKENLGEAPDSLDLIIWYGRRLAYLGNYLEAIKVYSDAITKFPNSHRLRRHRGHLYITTRQLTKSIEDFEMAAYLSLNIENRVEPDGLPNALNQPLSNDKFNIWYHFGLAYYLNGRYDKALSAYKKCMEFSDNDDLFVATSYWQYLTYNKLGNKELAEKVLTNIPNKMKLIENDAYFQLLQLFKGNLNDESLMQKAVNADGNLDPTLGYGLGSYYQYKGRMAKANETFLKVLESPSWHSFGYIASEAELTTIFPTPRSAS